MPKVQVPVIIDFRDQKAVDAITAMVEGEYQDAAKVSAYTNEVMKQMAAGAIILPIDCVNRILAVDESLDEPEAITAAVESGSGIQGGEMVIRWPTDAAMTQPLQDRALMVGMTVERLLKDMMDTATANGWFWDLGSEVQTTFFSRVEAAEINELLGTKDYTAGDILEALRILKEKPEEESEESNPFAALGLADEAKV